MFLINNLNVCEAGGIENAWNSSYLNCAQTGALVLAVWWHCERTETAAERSSSISDMADEKPKVRDGTCLFTILLRLSVLYDI